MQSFVNKDHFTLDKNSMSIPSNLCLFSLNTVRLPKFSAIVSITFLFTYFSTSDSLLQSTYHAIVHCLSLMVLFYMHLSYGLIRNPCDFRVFEYRSYHSSADSIHPYKALRRCRYSTFPPFSACILFLCSGFTLHMMSTYSPSIFKG